MESEDRCHLGWRDVAELSPYPPHFRDTQMFTGQGLCVFVFVSLVVPDLGPEILPFYTEKQTEKGSFKSKLVTEMSPLLSAWCCS